MAWQASEREFRPSLAGPFPSATGRNRRSRTYDPGKRDEGGQRRHTAQQGSGFPMGLLNEARREFIAAPDSAKGQIVYKWPDINIRKFTRAIVEPDATAVFMSQGQVMGVLLPGQHTLDAKELPFLGMFVDWASAGNAFRAEIFFA